MFAGVVMEEVGLGIVGGSLGEGFCFLFFARLEEDLWV